MHVTQEEFEQIRVLINAYSGLALTSDKLYLAQSRLLPLLTKHSLGSFTELIEHLQVNKLGRLRDEFIEAMVTNETSFNRDTHPFETLRTSILPRLVSSKLERSQQPGIPFNKVRVWSVAASTGQEPYSIAMAIADYIAMLGSTKITRDQFWIVASDISEQALNVARNGIYAELEMSRGLSSEQKQKHFVRQGKKWEISRQLKCMIEFRKLNVLQNVSDMVGFDLVFCRNLLFYFDEPARVVVCNKMIDSLNPGGVLFIGSAEHLPTGWEKRLRQEQFGRTIVYVKQ